MKQKNFSLIELLIVIGILGALMTLVLPGFNDTSDESKDKVAKTEMREIQRAFQRFSSDVIFRDESASNALGNAKLNDIALYGLWPLLSDIHPVIPPESADYIKYDAYDAVSGLGRRAPYLEQEGLVQIFPVTIDETHTQIESCGQESRLVDDTGVEILATGTNNRIPVIKDPYGGYYRVLCPIARTSGDGHNLSIFKRLQRMVIVCTGPNRKLDTLPNSFIDASDNPHPSEVDDIVAQGDDIVMKLMPMAGF